MKKPKLVEVEWEDSTCARGWRNPDEVQEFLLRPNSTCYTAGYLVKKSRKTTVVALNINYDMRGELISIPTRMVKKVTQLRRLG